jgi:FkbM family methyltransferase
VNPAWLERTVVLPDRRTHVMLVDSAQTDGTTEMYLKGDGIWVNAYLVSVMFALTTRGSRVLDLGGFVGEFALAAAARGCEVVSVEANPDQAQMLATSAELNGFAGLRVLHAAVGDRTGSVSFESRGPYGQVAHGDDSTDSGYERVTQLTVDSLVAALGWDQVDFVKIDIEGSEAAALEGASRMLSAANAPTLLIECNTFVLRGLSPDPAALLRQVEAFGYTLYRVTPAGIWPWDACQFQPEVVCDYLALKGGSPVEAGLEIEPPLTLDEAAGLVAGEVGRESFDHSIAMAWALRFAPPQLLAHPEVQAAIKALQANPAEEIRAEADLIGKSRPEVATAGPSVHLYEEFDDAWAAERALRQCAEARLAIAAALGDREPPEAPSTEPLRLPPGPRALALARGISDFADRHPWLANIGRRLIRPRS